MNGIRIMLLVLGAIGLLISLAVLGLAALGYFGILADVSPNENRAIGIQALSFGLPAFICSLVMCVLGLRSLAWNR